MSKPPGHSGSPQDLDQLLYGSLLILGLDVAALEHKFKAPIIQKSFSRIDKRLGDAILHFLFVCLDREKAAKVFRDCWPLLDKKHESQFHKATFEWYKSLQQSYRQPVPTVMAKTFMAPGGPKFTSTLMTLTRMALHASISKRAPTYTLLNTPSHSRSQEQNWQTFQVLQAFKVKHSQNYIMKQTVRQSTLLSMRNEARELCGRYRRLCKEGERAVVELGEALSNDERFAQNQKDIFASASLATLQKAVLDDITQMNDCMDKMWGQVDNFQQVEGSAWEVLRPLLDGSAFLSHINGSAYSPQVPEMVYKTHASTVNKLKLEGLYREGKLDLLSLVQYSSLSLMVLLDTIRNTHNHTHKECSEKLQAQSWQVTSVGETVNELSDKLTSLLPTFSHSASTSYLRSMSDFRTSERVALADKSHLCPPTPPFTLSSKPVHSLRTSHVPLQLTPGFHQSSQSLAEDGFNVTPKRLLCGMGMIRASKKSPKPDVTYSPVTCKDNSITVREGIKEDIPDAGLSIDMLTVDLRGKYQRKKEEALRVDDHRPYRMHKGVGHTVPNSIPRKRLEKPAKAPSSKVPIKLSSKVTQLSVKEVNGTGEEKDILKYDVGPGESVKDLLIDKLADNIAKEINEFDDDSGTTESHNIQTLNETVWKTSTLDSGCAEMSKDSDTLLDAILDMNIIKKSEKSNDSKNNTPHKGSHMQNGKYAIQFQCTSPKTSTLIEETLNKLNTPQLGRHTHPTSMFHEAADEASEFSDQQTPLMSQEQNRCISKCDRKQKDSMPGLRGKLHFVTQTPTKNTRSPLGVKIPYKFDGLDTSPGSNFFTSRLPGESYRDSTVTELRNHSKARLDFLLELQQSSQKPYSVSQKENAEETKLKPNFLSYVEKLKKSQPPLAPDNENVKTEGNKKQKTSGITNNESTTHDVSADDWLTKDVSKEYYGNFTRMQNLLNLDQDATLIDTNPQDIHDGPEQNEAFVSARDMSHKFEAQRQSLSSLLPATSVFDTLTDSILGGELDQSLLTDKNVGEQIRRESLSSRRQSVASMRRLSLESNKNIFDSPVFEPDDCFGILDESDSCLLSTSSENI